VSPGRSPLIQKLVKNPKPPEVFRCLQRDSGCFFLDSGLVDGRLGRFSFIGCQPFLSLENRNRHSNVVNPSQFVDISPGNPFDEMGRLLDLFTLERADNPIPFVGGAVGYFSYDAGRYLETLPEHAIDDRELPEVSFGFYDTIYAYDHFANQSYLVSTGFPELDEAARFKRARERLEYFDLRLRGFKLPAAATPMTSPLYPAGVTGNFTHEAYLAAVEKARQYIISGDIFEVNLSQRFEVDLTMDPPVLYARLRTVNPAPFAAYLECGDFQILSASPERFLRLRGNEAETRPIKGTRKRGVTPEADKALAAELLASEKDRAENMMIVDLSRNDLGRVCRYGSVKVTELAALETFSTVFHLTSTIVGRLAEGRDRIDLLKAAFPGGSITGAPKIRAMEIIDELEPTRRGIYTGAIGYFGFDGDFDLNIAIRTIVTQGKRAYFQVGGAVTFDSDPQFEFEETLHKAKALFQALGTDYGV